MAAGAEEAGGGGGAELYPCCCGHCPAGIGGPGVCVYQGGREGGRDGGREWWLVTYKICTYAYCTCLYICSCKT